MNKLYVFILLLFACIGYGQNVKIQPSTWATPDHLVQEKKMPLQDNEILYHQEMKLRTKGRADHFATPLKVNIDIAREGTWSIDENGMAVCKYKITSKGAHSLNFGFSNYALAKSANLLFYNIDQTDIKGPFTIYSSGSYDQLWTPIIQGDEIIIELQVPEKDRSKNILLLSYVNHDFIGFLGSRASGSCNIDVNCGEADGFPEIEKYRDIISSVGAYHLNGISTCSGALINNTDNDCTPYFLTADHCGINNSNAASMVVYWNYENSYCREPWGTESGRNGDGTLNDYNTGAILRANSAETDFALVELIHPLKISSKLHAAGFKAELGLTNTSIAIHHPNVEEKRISFDYDDPIYRDNNHYIRVENWDEGTTEGGSSGSPLFNTNGQIIGQLYGGYAACGNQEWDEYGTLAISWDGENTASTRLKDWLDRNNTGIKTMNTKNCSNSITATNNIPDICLQTDTTFAIQFFIEGELKDSIYISINNEDGLVYNLSQNVISREDTITLTFIDLHLLNSGKYSFSIAAKDSFTQIENIYSFNIYEDIPSVPLSISPTNDASNIIQNPTLSWTGDAKWYDVEVAEDELFENIIFSNSGSLDTFVKLNRLNLLTKYYWRVKGSNVCGSSEWNATQSFITNYSICNLSATNDTLITIPDNENIVTSSITFEESATITKLKINRIKGSHTYVSDLTFTLLGPNGKSVVLIDKVCRGQDNFDFAIDEEIGSNYSCPLGNFQVIKTSNGALNNFIGENIKGTWTLIIEDHENFDGGSLEYWTLEACTQFEGVLSSISKENDNVCITDTIYNNIEVVNSSNEIVYISPVFDSENIEFTLETNEVLPFTKAEIPFSFYSINSGSIDTNTLNFVLSNQLDTLMHEFHYIFKPLPIAGNNIYPINEDVLWQDNPEFLWEAGTNVEGYEFELFYDIDGEITPLFDTILTENKLILPFALDYHTVYKWKVTYFNNCDKFTNETTSFNIVIVGTTSINFNRMLEIKPNPVSNILHISGIENHHTSTIEIISTSGNTVFKKENYSAKTIDIDVNHMNAGMYLLKVSNESSSTIQKFIKL